jgi:hypothetical protein
MLNHNMPSNDDLPSTQQLVRSTIIAIITAILILVTIVLPAEYGIDPTGIGRMLQLTEMGEIKTQLAEEAARDKELHDPEASTESLKPQSSLAGRILAGLFISSAYASEPPSLPSGRKDTTTIALKPAEGVEWKMKMRKGAEVTYAWSVAGGVVNYDMHGTPQGGGAETSYKKARGIGSDAGVMTAGFDGTHGWFFRNRGQQPVTITLRTSGDYTDLKRVQ